MNILEAINSRKSIRGYKPDPVHREILAEIIDIATRSPSAMNTQPWEITLVTGEILDSIRRGNVEMLTSGAAPHPDVPLEAFEGEYRQRQVGLAVQLFQLMGIAREDKEKRASWLERGFRFFDAPAAIILSVDKSVGDLKRLSNGGDTDIASRRTPAQHRYRAAPPYRARTRPVARRARRGTGRGVPTR